MKGIGMAIRHSIIYLIVCSLELLSWGRIQGNLTQEQQNNLSALIEAIDSRKFIFDLSWTDVINERHNGATALHCAIVQGEKGNKNIVQQLLSHGADPEIYLIDENEFFHQFNALHLAVTFGYLKIVTLLLKKNYKNININARVGNGNTQGLAGFTSLHLASRYGDINLVNLLLKNGANVLIKTSPNNKNWPNTLASEVATDKKVKKLLWQKEKDVANLKIIS